MKVRNSFVTNSSSSSFLITANEYHPEKTNKEHIKEVIEDVLGVFKKYDNGYYDGVHDYSDYEIFEGSEIEKIAERLHDEWWSASGIRLPDDVHKMFCSLSYSNNAMRPKEQDLKKVIKDLISKYGEEKVRDIIDYDSIKFSMDEIVCEDRFLYKDEEFQNAIRADFVVITGENVFPYSTREVIQDLLHADYNHLG